MLRLKEGKEQVIQGQWLTGIPQREERIWRETLEIARAWPMRNCSKALVAQRDGRVQSSFFLVFLFSSCPFSLTWIRYLPEHVLLVFVLDYYVGKMSTKQNITKKEKKWNKKLLMKELKSSNGHWVSKSGYHGFWWHMN